VVHASIVPCNTNLLGALRSDAPAETTADDNLQTVRLVYAAYDSARDNCVVAFDHSHHEGSMNVSSCVIED
jgi:hypothetical protein